MEKIKTLYQKRPLLIYDDECSLCVRFKQTIEHLKKDDEVFFVSLHDHKLYEELPSLKKQDCADIVHMIDGEGNILTGEEVVGTIINLIPITKKFSWMLSEKARIKASEVFYNTVDRLRKTSSSCKKC